MFHNAHHFTIQNSTFINVGEDYNVNNIHPNAQIIESVPSRTPASTYRTDLPVRRLALPCADPCKSFISLLVVIQQAFEPIGSIINEYGMFSVLQDLRDIITAAPHLERLWHLTGAHHSRFFGSRVIEERIEICTPHLQKAVDEIHRYQEGLRFTLIGPI